MQRNDIRIDGERLWRSLMEMASIGATEFGGCNRQALTDEDRLGRDLFCKWCEEAGCTVRVDEMGNLFSRRDGSEPQRDPILIGSHLDTQPTGGKFDGVYGVLAGLEVIRTLNDHETSTAGPIDIVVWTNEEGVRFSPAMNGSGVWAGMIDQSEAYAQRAVDGVAFRDALKKIGYLGAQPAHAFPIRAAFEAHIEQGPVLEAAGNQIGVVTGVQAMRWYDLSIEGTPCHAGTTPMRMRHDPLLSLAQIVSQFSNELDARDVDARATFALLESEPGSRNTVAQCVGASLDLRHPRAATLEDLEQRCLRTIAEVCEANGTRGSLDRIWDSPPVRFDPICVDAVREAAALLDYRFQEIISGAGHDAVNVSRVAPTSMIFVPCAGGLSHNEAESATPLDLAAGANVLLQAVLSIDAKPP